MIKKYILLIFSVMAINAVNAGDLDDGIGIDQPNNDDLSLDKNIKFITRKAIAKAKSQQGGGTSACGSGNVVIGPGSKVKEVINVSTNKGTTAVCGQ